jgi:hypothetical protein
MEATYRPLSPFNFEQSAASPSNDHISVEFLVQAAAQRISDDAQVRSETPRRVSNTQTQSDEEHLLHSVHIASCQESVSQSQAHVNDGHVQAPSRSSSPGQSGGHASLTRVGIDSLDTQSSPSSQKQESLPWRLWTVWKWELFAWLLGTIGLIANIALMIASDKKLLKDWKSDVQITAFVATLAQLSQSSLLVPIASSIAQLKWDWAKYSQATAKDIHRFDLASRGPDGSIRLLWYLSWRQ